MTTEIDIPLISWPVKREEVEITPKLLFHYSPFSNRKSIRKNGLLIEHPKSGRLWDIQKPGVFLFINPLQAWEWQTSVHAKLTFFDPFYSKYERPSQQNKLFKWNHRKDDGRLGDVWIVKTDNLTLKKDKLIPASLVSSDNISSEDIALMPQRLISDLYEENKHLLSLDKDYNHEKYWEKINRRLKYELEDIIDL